MGPAVTSRNSTTRTCGNFCWSCVACWTHTRQIIAILLEGTIDFTPAQVAAADAMCKAADAPLLSAVRAPFWRKVPKILARRKIRNQEEYYLVVERLNDVGPTGLA